MEGRDAPVNGNLNDLFKEQEIRLCELAFEGQFHYGMFYAYFRLKEQEIDNVEYIAYLTMLGDINDQTKNIDSQRLFKGFANNIKIRVRGRIKHVCVKIIVYIYILR